jgi:hypothetical protein
MVETIEGRLARKMMIHDVDMRATKEHLCMSALQGTTKDADGATLRSGATDMGVSLPSEVNYDFDVTTNDPNKITAGIIRTAENTLGAIKPLRWHALMGPTFADDMTHNADIKASYDRALAAMDTMAAAAGLGDWRRMNTVRMPPFYYAGVWWEEYRGGTDYIADTKAVIFPVFDGVQAEVVYPIWYGPADYFDTVNTLGRPMYARMMTSPAPERLAPFEMQTNLLPFVTRPNAITMARNT